MNLTEANGSNLNLDNVSFKGADIADIMGLKAELERHEREQDEFGGENTLNITFNKESSLQGPPDFGGGTINSH
jgi:prophage antirepressor-like protein